MIISLGVFVFCFVLFFPTSSFPSYLLLLCCFPFYIPYTVVYLNSIPDVGFEM